MPAAAEKYICKLKNSFLVYFLIILIYFVTNYLFIYLLVKEKKIMTHSNQILKMEVKNKERLYHEIVQNKFAFSKSLGKTFFGGKENIAVEKEIRTTQQKF